MNKDDEIKRLKAENKALKKDKSVAFQLWRVTGEDFSKQTDSTLGLIQVQNQNFNNANAAKELLRKTATEHVPVFELLVKRLMSNGMGEKDARIKARKRTHRLVWLRIGMRPGRSLSYELYKAEVKSP